MRIPDAAQSTPAKIYCSARCAMRARSERYRQQMTAGALENGGSYPPRVPPRNPLSRAALYSPTSGDRVSFQPTDESNQRAARGVSTFETPGARANPQKARGRPWRIAPFAGVACQTARCRAVSCQCLQCHARRTVPYHARVVVAARTSAMDFRGDLARCNTPDVVCP
jgi:hypothetical protein